MMFFSLLQYQFDFVVVVVVFRTATDFASAMDGIWPFFAAAGCRRTTKAQLIDMDIVKKVWLWQP